MCHGWWSWTPKLAATLFVVVSSVAKGSMHARFHMWKMCVALPGGTFATLWQHELGGETAHGVAKVKAKVASDGFTTPPLYLSHTSNIQHNLGTRTHCYVFPFSTSDCSG